MYFTYLKLIFFLINFGSSQKVEARNIAKKKAEFYYTKENYSDAIIQLNLIPKSTFNFFSEVNLNVANCYLALNRSKEAYKHIKLIEKLEDVDLRPKILNTLGCIALRENDTLKALDLFKLNLLIDSDNQIASYNFELLSKSYSKRYNQLQNKKNKELSNTKALSKNLALEKNEEKKVELPKIEKSSLTQNGALNLLNAMKENEIQFIQQLNVNKLSKSTKQKKW